MENNQQAAPAGDIGNHVLSKVIVILTGVVGLLALVGFFIAHHYNAYQAAIYPGLYVHQWQYNPELAASSHYNFKLGSVFFGLNIVFLKIAILIDWIHTFVPTGTRNALFWILHTLIWSNAVFYLIGTFIEAFQCPPEDVGTPRCNINVPSYNIASGVINVISDLTILFAPHWVIWKLNLSRVRKIGVSVLFLIGALATGSAIARVITVTSAYSTGDISYYVVTINLWAMAEQTFGYLVIGIPALPKVLHDLPCAKHLGSLVRSRSKHTTNPSAYYNRETWPNSVPRRYREIWERSDLDTNVLVTTDVIVTTERGEEKGIPLQGVAPIYGRGESRDSSADEVGMAVTRANICLKTIITSKIH
ncbi:hypothetical protein F4678DRAFT_484124 [Xylaria arbuscula]|nr:hypothetical protein F4678DRAFT_484124 [Xylaria arbuscula]